MERKAIMAATDNERCGLPCRPLKRVYLRTMVRNELAEQVFNAPHFRVVDHRSGNGQARATVLQNGALECEEYVKWPRN